MSQQVFAAFELESHVGGDGDTEEREVVESAVFSWKSYFCFLFMTTSVVAMQGYFKGSANSALGTRHHAPTMSLCMFGTGIVMNLSTPYWMRWFSPKTRLTFACAVIAASITVLLLFGSASRSYATEDTTLYWERLMILFAASLNAIGHVSGEVTVMETMSRYHHSCTNAFSTGCGVGGLLGAAWAITSSKDAAIMSLEYSVVACYCFPLLLFLLYFLVLQPPEMAEVTTDDETQNTADDKCDELKTGNSLTDFKRFESLSASSLGVSSAKNSVSSEVTLAEQCEAGQLKSSRNSFNNDGGDPMLKFDALEIPKALQSRLDAVKKGVIDSKKKTAAGCSEDLGLDKDNGDEQYAEMGICKAMSTLLCTLSGYTLPLFAVYFCWELCMNGFINHLFCHTDSVFKYVNWCARMGVFAGKSSTNVQALHFKRMIVFPSVLLSAMAVVSAIYFVKPQWGQLTVVATCVYVAAVPFGVVYGSSSANIYRALRDIKDPHLRTFALSNVRQATTYGQISGNIAAIPLSFH